MKELNEPENFKSLKQMKLLRKKFMCIERKTYLLLASCIIFLANNFRPWRKVSFVNQATSSKVVAFILKKWCLVYKCTVPILLINGYYHKMATKMIHFVAIPTL